MIIVNVQDFRDSRVCKSYLLGFCVHDVLAETKYVIGPCPKIHDPLLKKAYVNSYFCNLVTKKILTAALITMKSFCFLSFVHRFSIVKDVLKLYYVLSIILERC